MERGGCDCGQRSGVPPQARRASDRHAAAGVARLGPVPHRRAGRARSPLPRLRPRPGGGLSCNAKGRVDAKPTWVSCRPGFFLPVRVLSRVFRAKYRDGLRRHFDDGRLVLPDRLRDPAAFVSWLAEQFCGMRNDETGSRCGGSRRGRCVPRRPSSRDRRRRCASRPKDGPDADRRNPPFGACGCPLGAGTVLEVIRRAMESP